MIVGGRAVNALPDFVNGYKGLIAALGHFGRRNEAKPYVDKLLTLEPISPLSGTGRSIRSRRRLTAGAIWRGCASPASLNASPFRQEPV